MTGPQENQMIMVDWERESWLFPKINGLTLLMIMLTTTAASIPDLIYVI